jgi:hypothetical protein
MDANFHVGTSSIQGWSVGEIFPYHVVLQGKDKLYAMHADGSKLTTYYYGEGHDLTFGEAHRRAEQESRAMLAANRTKAA